MTEISVLCLVETENMPEKDGKQKAERVKKILNNSFQLSATVTHADRLITISFGICKLILSPSPKQCKRSFVNTVQMFVS